MHERHEESGKGCVVCDVEFSGESPPIWRDKRFILIVISATLFSVGLLFEFIPRWEMLAGTLFLATAVISGYSIAREGFSSLIFRKKLSIDFLIMVAAVGSFFIGHGEEGATDDHPRAPPQLLSRGPAVFGEKEETYMRARRIYEKGLKPLGI